VYAAENLVIESRGALELSASDITTGGDVRLNVDNRNRDNSRSALRLMDLRVAGLEVHSRGSLDLTVEDVMAHHVSASLIDRSMIRGPAFSSNTPPTSTAPPTTPGPDDNYLVEFSTVRVAQDVSIEGQGSLQFAADDLTIGRDLNIDVSGGLILDEADLWFDLEETTVGGDVHVSHRFYLIFPLTEGDNIHRRIFRFFEVIVSGDVRIEQSGLHSITELVIGDTEIGGNLDVRLVGAVSDVEIQYTTIGAV
jgi:hypothetical protein